MNAPAPLAAEEAAAIDAMLRPSSAHRWMQCSASPRVEAGVPDRTSEAAALGTLAHWVAEQCLKLSLQEGGCSDPHTLVGTEREVDGYRLRVSTEMAQAVASYMKHVQSQPGTLAVEVAGNLAGILPNNGSSDAVVIDWDDDTLYVNDLKYGQGVRVFAKENLQLMLYALGQRQRLAPLGTFKRYVLTIEQPRLDHVDWWECTNVELDALAARAKEAAAAAHSEFPQFVPGSHCKFCRFKPQCKAYAEAGLSAVSKLFGDVRNFTPVDPAVLTPEEVGSILSKAGMLIDLLSTLDRRAHELIKTGTPVPGWKLVDGRKGNRVWKSEDEAIAACKKMRLKVDQYMPRSFASVAQLEKEFETKEVFAEKMGKLITRGDGNPVLAPESDKRPAHSPALQFDDVSVPPTTAQSFLD